MFYLLAVFNPIVLRIYLSQGVLRKKQAYELTEKDMSAMAIRFVLSN